MRYISIDSADDVRQAMRGRYTAIAIGNRSPHFDLDELLDSNPEVESLSIQSEFGADRLGQSNLFELRNLTSLAVSLGGRPLPDRIPANLQSINFSGAVSGDPNIALSQANRLVHVDINSSRLDAPLDIASLAQPEALLWLSFWGNSPALPTSLTKSPNLFYLDFSLHGTLSRRVDYSDREIREFWRDKDDRRPQFLSYTTGSGLGIEVDEGRHDLSAIEFLEKLEWLSLAGRRIGNDDLDLASLPGLKHLDISSNGLQRLDLRRQRELRSLIAHSNRIDSAPVFGSVDALMWLDLQDNLLDVPPELLAQRMNVESILEFLAPDEDATELRRAKVILVGEAFVGKTSLSRRITRSGVFDPDEPKTEGIVIANTELDVDGRNVDVNVWDFGGQEIMHATHQFFMTKRAVYLVVLDNRLSEEQNRLHYWMSMVASFGGGAPIIVVANKCDVQRIDLDRRGLAREFGVTIAAIIETSCIKGTGIDALRSTISDALGGLPHVFDLVPRRFFALVEELENLKDDYIPFEAYSEICARHRVLSNTTQSSYASLLHDLGVVLIYREDDRLLDRGVPVSYTHLTLPTSDLV